MSWRSAEYQLIRLRQVIRTQGGTLLSKTYVNRATKVTVRCREGHVWDVQPAKLHQGRWCPVCHYKRLRTYTTQKSGRRAQSSAPLRT